ncbi:thioredoxin domain-containing protein [Nitrosophilus kaiyonis]|uniref:thioredoxin domain-containing protein n=1 Tax=Nitrosophilus kaiyonis TaxID=2930200 RepID=UPI002492E263|nr:thioredoxin domain-containing protein [Nitrosophilus kaiyonis]
MKKLFLLFFVLGAFLFAEHKYTNELIYEESPYLLQHAHNPVNWLPWGEKAFQKAKKEHKPIFLSIGYSTCHWCHVMEKESFENEEIAKIINENFVPIKVDKEERPDIDKFYQKVYQIMHNRSGGWPLTIILTEDLKPFFSATYLPPEDGYGVKGLKTVLPILAKAYKNERDYIEKRADAILTLMKKIENQEYVPVQLDFTIAKKFVMQAKEQYDKTYKGFSKRIKFPESSKIRALIDIYLITKDNDAFNMANDTLITMAKSGLYDQINGGFFRYTTDRKWQIPHFEKMLYTNAELIDVYSRMYKITKNPLFKKVVIETINEIDNRFKNKNSLYSSASDADTNGIEGGFFIFNYEKCLDYFLKNGFKKDETIKVLKYFGITEDGNIDGEYSNPYINEEIKISKDKIKKAKNLLKKIRETKEYPFIDKKIITSWNAMMIDAKLKSFFIDERFKKSALVSLDNLIKTMYINKNLYHQIKDKNIPTKKALLEDYAYLIKALITAYEVTLEKRYLILAEELQKKAKELFFKNGKWYLSVSKFKSVADLNDSYYTSPLAIMIHNLLKLSALKEDLKLLNDAKYIIDKNSALIFHNPIYYPEATRAVFREKLGDIVIKNSKNVLKKYLLDIAMLDYPYILVKSGDYKEFLACKIDTCFANNKEFNKIKEKIESILNPKTSKSDFEQKWGKRVINER